MEYEIKECLSNLFDGSLSKRADATTKIAIIFEIKYSPRKNAGNNTDVEYYKSMVPEELLRTISEDDEALILEALSKAKTDKAISHSVYAVIGKCTSNQGLSALLGLINDSSRSMTEKECDQALFSLTRFYKLKDSAITNRINSELSYSFIERCKVYSPSEDYSERLEALIGEIRSA